MSDEFRGHEPELLRALGISWRHGTRRHMRCPFPDHDDKHPSWRWDDGDSRWYCSGNCGNGDILDAVVRMGKARGYIEAKDWCRQAIGKRPPGKGVAKAAPIRNEVYQPATRRPSLEQLRHPVHGVPKLANVATYKFADSKIAEMRVRYEHADGKEVVPWTLVGGRWRMKQMPGPRPLYRLTTLLKEPDKPVLFVEGEGRKAKRAVELFPDFAVTATSGGCKGFAGMDYSPLKGRRIVVWPDNDEPGRQYAQDVCRRALEAGATEARIVDVPVDWPATWDLGDEPPNDSVDLREMLDEAWVWQAVLDDKHDGSICENAQIGKSQLSDKIGDKYSSKYSDEYPTRPRPNGTEADTRDSVPHELNPSFGTGCATDSKIRVGNFAEVIPFSTLGAAAAPQSRPAQQPQSKFKLTRLRDIQPLLNGMWLVKGLLPARGLCTVFGEPGCGKSFLTLDLVLHVATGREYAGRKVKQARVVYVAAEGQGGFRNRVVEAAKALGIDDNAQFDLIEVAPNLGVKDGDADELIRAIEEQAQPDDAPVGAIVVDTTSQTMGGENENLEGMAMFIQNANHIGAHFGCLSIALHHVGKSDTQTPRGWSGLHGANDTELKVTGLSNPHGAEIVKQKDGETGLSFQFNLNRVEVGLDEDGDPVTTCIVEKLGNPEVAKAAPREAQAPRVPRRQREFDAAFGDALLAHGEDYFIDGDGPMVRALYVHQIRPHFAKRWATDEPDKVKRGGRIREAFRSVLKTLPPKYHTRQTEVGERIWRTT